MITEGAPKPDADEVLKVGSITLEFFRAAGFSRQKPFELLEALYGKTKEYLDGAVSIDDAEFTYAELTGLIKRAKKDSSDSGDANKYIGENLKKLGEYAAENRSELDALLREKGLRHRLLVSRSGVRGGKGNKAYVYLALASLEEGTSGSESHPTLSADGLAYYRVHQLLRTPWWARPYERFVLDGMPLYVIVVAVALTFVLVVIGVPLAWFFLPQAVVSVISTVEMVVLCTAWWLFGWFYRLLGSTIEMAPGWLSGLHNLYVQIELRLTDSVRANGKPIREIRMISYRAECPVCGNEVDVRGGKYEFRGRLIGVCSESSREHLFSFDHISRIGVPLRSNAYYGKAKS